MPVPGTVVGGDPLHVGDRDVGLVVEEDRVLPTSVLLKVTELSKKVIDGHVYALQRKVTVQL